MRVLRLTLLATVLAALTLPVVQVFATSLPPAATAQTIRESLFNAQIALISDPASAEMLLADVKASYTGDFAQTLQAAAPEADTRIRAGISDATEALASDNAPAFAAAYGQ